jgi:hypothetical protein
MPHPSVANADNHVSITVGGISAVVVDSGVLVVGFVLIIVVFIIINQAKIWDRSL